MPRQSHFSLIVIALITATLALGACTSMLGVGERRDVAKRIAAPAYLIERQIAAAPFSLTAFERMHKNNAPANIYIEGDGLAWISKSQRSMNPTPKNPVALHLAAMDKAQNVAYLARPCQYSQMVDGSPCPPKYWSQKRMAPEVLTAMNAALDDIKARYDVTSFNLIGFSGGGGVAAILAALRDDVTTLRSVAGNIDHRAHSLYHDVSFLEGSLNPPDFADKLRSIPQIHFIGGQDQIVPPAIAHSYMEAIGQSSCARLVIVQEAEHDEGWVDKWPALLADVPLCAAAPVPAYHMPPAMPETFHVTPESASKP